MRCWANTNWAPTPYLHLLPYPSPAAEAKVGVFVVFCKETSEEFIGRWERKAWFFFLFVVIAQTLEMSSGAKWLDQLWRRFLSEKRDVSKIRLIPWRAVQQGKLILIYVDSFVLHTFYGFTSIKRQTGKAQCFILANRHHPEGWNPKQAIKLSGYQLVVRQLFLIVFYFKIMPLRSD